MPRSNLAPVALALLALLAIVTPWTPASATQAATEFAEEPTLAEELRLLNTTLTEIKELLERQAETQGLDLLMKRMELSSAQAAEIEKRLREAEGRRQAVDDELTQLEERMEFITADYEGGGFDGAQYETYVEQADAQRRRLGERLREIEGEIAGIENRLAAKRRDLDDWQTYIDRRLGGI